MYLGQGTDPLQPLGGLKKRGLPRCSLKTTWGHEVPLKTTRHRGRAHVSLLQLRQQAVDPCKAVLLQPRAVSSREHPAGSYHRLETFGTMQCKRDEFVGHTFSWNLCWLPLETATPALASTRFVLTGEHSKAQAIPSPQRESIRDHYFATS